MKKVIRLTEGDLAKIVNRTIKEQTMQYKGYNSNGCVVTREDVESEVYATLGDYGYSVNNINNDEVIELIEDLIETIMADIKHSLEYIEKDYKGEFKIIIKELENESDEEDYDDEEY